MSHAIASEALDKAGAATESSFLLDEFCKIFTSAEFLASPNPKGPYGSIVAGGLWRDRGSFMTLCSRGLLPGCALLLLAISTLLKLNQNQDRDRQILRSVAATILEKEKFGSKNEKHFLSVEDSRTIRQAYSGLLFVWQQDTSSIEDISLDFLGTLNSYVLFMTAFNPSVVIQDEIEVAYTSLRFLWLLFEQRGRMPATDHAGIRYCSLDVFQLLRLIQSDCESARQEQPRFAQMLADCEIVSLIGRIILLILVDGNEFHNTEHLSIMLEKLQMLDDAINKSAAAAPELFRDSKIEWMKVFSRLLLCSEGENTSGNDPDRARLVSSMLNTWYQFATSLSVDYSPPQRFSECGTCADNVVQSHIVVLIANARK
ncbi:hypothetical protein FRC06_009107 [Ceratobasidium sp. 370]|nr:hypothetical protein FRC06_009107 [Ceratobasidium sp. 370]